MKNKKMIAMRNHVAVAVALLLVVGMAALVATMRPVQLNAEQDDSRRYTAAVRQWKVNEQGWTGVWTRRGNSNQFDARWTMPGQNDIQGVIEMHFSDRDVRMNRTDLNTNQRCEYRGQISPDGRTAQGWVSCSGGPRMNWTANLITDGFQGTPEAFPPPPVGGYEQREGPIIPKYNQSNKSWQYDLTGIWRCNDGGTYYLRQLGNHLWWYGEASNGQWSNIFHGALDGDWLEGFWLDVPKGRDRDNGALRLHIDSRDEFHREQKSGDDFGGSRWRRER
jgi:hypothetical protein